MLVGSSSFSQPFGFIIARELERWGYDVTRKGVPGAGLARPDYRDMNQVLEELPIGPNTVAVFVYLGVNDAQALWLYPHERTLFGLTSLPLASAEWDTEYQQRARDFYERICKRGAQRAIVLLPVDVNRPVLQEQLARIRNLQMQAAALTSCAVTLDTAGDAGHFELNGVAQRLPDGFHMTSQGAQLVWERIREQVLVLLDGRSVAHGAPRPGGQDRGIWPSRNERPCDVTRRVRSSQTSRSPPAACRAPRCRWHTWRSTPR